jgi:hypothetical protein
VNGVTTPLSSASETIKATSLSNAGKICNEGDNTISGVSTDCEIK